MLLDKSGLRKKDKNDEDSEKKGGSKLKGFNQSAKKPTTVKAAHDQAVQTALKYGIGYEQYKKEVDAIRAASIRGRLEKAHKK